MIDDEPLCLAIDTMNDYIEEFTLFFAYTNMPWYMKPNPS